MYVTHSFFLSCTTNACGLAPTPLSLSFNELSMRGADDALVKMALMQVLQDKTDVKYDVVKFVQHILKFTPDDIPERAKGYTLDDESCRFYASRTYQKLDTPHQQDFAGERACCHAFQDIVWDLARQLQSKAKDTRSFPAKLMYMHDRIVHGDFASYKPDFGYGAPIRTNKHRWEFLGACGEMKKTRASHFRAARNRPITMARIKEVGPNLLHIRICLTSIISSRRHSSCRTESTQRDRRVNRRHHPSHQHPLQYVTQVIRDYLTHCLCRNLRG